VGSSDTPAACGVEGQRPSSLSADSEIPTRNPILTKKEPPKATHIPTKKNRKQKNPINLKKNTKYALPAT
jgi:hypothetical protein